MLSTEFAADPVSVSDRRWRALRLCQTAAMALSATRSELASLLILYASLTHSSSLRFLLMKKNTESFTHDAITLDVASSLICFCAVKSVVSC